MPLWEGNKQEGGRMTLAAKPADLLAKPADLLTKSADLVAKPVVKGATPSLVSNDTWMNNLSPELKVKYEKYLKQQRDYVNNTKLSELDVLITISNGLYIN
jgi:hypothetical protein